MAGLAHNVLKAVKKLRQGVGPPDRATRERPLLKPRGTTQKNHPCSVA